MSYNFLRDASSIRNSFLCRYDTLNGYTTDFNTNGDVDGWDVYTNVYLYGCWNGVLFGSISEKEAYIGRTDTFIPVSAENFRFIKIMMKITSNDTSKTTPEVGKIRWTRLGDSSWDSDKEYEFDIYADDEWHLYQIDMGPAQWWVGSITNLRIYPIFDGWKEDKFAIKYITVYSPDTYVCTNTSCDYYTNYVHECPGAGSRGYAQAGTSQSLYTTVSGISDELSINIDGYGYEIFSLGSNENLTGVEMARVINNALASLNIGGYAFSLVEYTSDSVLKINSGSVGSSSSVLVSDTPAARNLGFYTSLGASVYTSSIGSDPASGFDYASSRLLTSLEITRLIDNKYGSIAYTHNPIQKSVEGGRRNFNEVGNRTSTLDLNNTQTYDSFDNSGKTIIDLSNPFNSNGKISTIYICGNLNSDAKVKIIRPKKNGNFTVVHSLDVPEEDSSKMYTTQQNVLKIECDVLVSRGDYIGVYDANLFVGKSWSGDPDATFYQIDGAVSGTFDPGVAYSYGIGGFSIYGHSNRLQSNTVLDIDMGERVNIDELKIFGSESSYYFEYNIASCLDVNWAVDTFGGTHKHITINSYTMERTTHTHSNDYYGSSCLSDCIRTPDNGNAGDALQSDTGTLSYFYVAGDAEWGYSSTCDGKHEFCGTAQILEYTMGFVYDPIAFSLIFPNGMRTNVHKVAMYFKDRDNFRSMALSYYLGAYNATGNADNNHYRLIPSYNTVSIDGVSYAADDSDNITNYLFVNPSNARLKYVAGEVDNFEEFDAATTCRWNIIEYTFDPVDCYGFRIYTTHHHSTKIMELEVYSRMYSSASLVDNVSLIYSDYGDEWDVASFEEVSTGEIHALVGGMPRYFQLEFNSQTAFSVNELEMFVGNQVKTSDCAEEVYLSDAPANSAGNQYAVAIQNTYDKLATLTIDIPKNTIDTEGVVFWSKLNSVSDVSDPDIGPGSFLNTSEEYTIGNDNYQCAINDPCYGLKNLVDGKTAYYYERNPTLCLLWDVDCTSAAFGHYTNADLVKPVTPSIMSDNSTSISLGVSGYIQNFSFISIDFGAGNEKCVKKFRLWLYASESKDAFINSGDGVFQGSNDSTDGEDGTWDDILTLTSDALGTPVYPGWSDYVYVGNDTYYRWYRLSGVDQTTNAVGIEWEMMECASWPTPYTWHTYGTLVSGTSIDYYNVSSGGFLYDNYFAIDLGSRHNLSIIRNYGDADDKLFISTTAYTEYSNTDLANINSVVWGNSDHTDARWVRINLLCGDDTDRCIRKLGIYPNIEDRFSPGGGYNCEWEFLGTALTSYLYPINVAYGAIVTGTNNYFRDYYPEKAVDGVSDDYSLDACWAFEIDGGVDPYIELDFGATYTIDKIKLYHGYDSGDEFGLNTEYTFSVSLTTSGSNFTEVLSISGNASYDVEYVFTPVSARRARLTITDYNNGRMLIEDDDGNYTEFTGSLMREVEVYTSVSSFSIESEDWPVVCINLQDQFNITDHELINDVNNDSDTDWDNSETFFRYSDSIHDAPNKVSFSSTLTGESVLARWAAITRDTAENYSYDDDSDKYGSDYLTTVKVYGNTKYIPTEYDWWWSSNLSTITKDYFITRVGESSIHLSYPTSSGTDTFAYIEGDDFGIDDNWSIKDNLSFGLYIDNVNNLDTSFGDIIFGIINDASPIYYTWDISALSLSTGWNNILLNFDEYSSVYPVSDEYALSTILNESLDLRNNERECSSFRMRYRGVGNALNLYIDDIKISRSLFNRNAKFNKGLCLTGQDYLYIPVTEVGLNRGAMEFWLKPYTDSTGRDIFNKYATRVLFTLSSNVNDILSLIIKSGNWFVILAGNIRDTLIFTPTYSSVPNSGFFTIDELTHIGLVWNNDGTLMGNSDTLRLYLNGNLVFSTNRTWDISDTKSAMLKLGGGGSQIIPDIYDSYGSGVFDNLKIYNYCKTDFNIYTQGVEKDTVYMPNDFIQISSDGSNFYGAGSSNLPLTYCDVPANDSRTVYIRSNKNNNFKQSVKKTADVIVEWTVAV